MIVFIFQMLSIFHLKKDKKRKIEDCTHRTWMTLYLAKENKGITSERKKQQTSKLQK